MSFPPRKEFSKKLINWISAYFSLLHAFARMMNITQGMRMSFPGKRDSQWFCLHKCQEDRSV